MRKAHINRTVRKAGPGLLQSFLKVRPLRSAQASSACLRPHASCTTRITPAQGPPLFCSCFRRPARRRGFFLLPNGSLAFVRILRESMHLPSVLPRRELTNLAAFLCSSLPTDTRTRRFGFFCSIGSRCPVARCSRHGDRYQGFRSGRCPEIHIRTQSAIRWPGAVLARGERRPRAPCAMRVVHVGGLLRTYSVKLKPGRSSPKG